MPIRSSILSTCLLFLISYSVAQTATNKQALIFAIANYPKEKGWPTLSSMADAERMRSTLLRQGFDTNSITIVKDEQCTVEGLGAAFSELIGRVKPGDIVVIHFSCHGERVKSVNDNKLDGLDECIVSFDAVAPTVSTDFDKDQAGYFRGPQLGKYITALRTKLGEQGDLMVFLDYCYSGSGTRGMARIRGGQPPLVPKGFDASQYRKSDSSRLTRQLERSATEKGLSPFIVISATKPYETDSETIDENGQDIGSLTYAVSKSFEKLDPNTTYRSFFANIQTIMNLKVPGQHPLMEGNGTDRLILGGAFREQKPFFEIQKILKGHQLVLNGGLTSGLDTGLEVSLFPKGVSDPARSTALSTGKIIQSENFSSIVQLNQDPGISQPSAGWVFVTDHHYRIDPVNIGLNPFKPQKNDRILFTDWEKDIRAALQTMPFIRWEGNPELTIVHGKIFDTIKIASNGYSFATVKNGDDHAKTLQEKMRQYAQYKFLQQLNFSMPGISMDVQLIPLVQGRPDTTKISSHRINGLYEFTDREQMVLLIRNTGTRDAYINILDMQPDGLINPVLPNRAHSLWPYDLKLRAGESRLLSEYPIAIAPPYGTEVFKIFVSPKEIDMETIAQSRGEQGREDISLFEKILQSSYTLSRGDELKNKGNADGTTYNLFFRIKPAK